MSGTISIDGQAFPVPECQPPNIVPITFHFAAKVNGELRDFHIDLEPVGDPWKGKYQGEIPAELLKVPSDGICLV